MKSLTSLLLIASVAALIGVGFLAVTPVFANNPTDESPISAEEPAAPITGALPEALPAVDVQVVADESPISAEEPAAPITGALPEALPAVDVQVVAVVAPEVSTASAEAFAGTLSINIQKDRAGAEAAVASEAQAVTSLNDFVASVNNGKASQVTGIYAEGTFAYTVTRQPSGNAAYVSPMPSEVTEFGLAGEYGSQGFLAHNYLAGANFSELAEGQTIVLVYGDGSTETFVISEILSFQALSPDSTQSSFVDLESGDQLSASTLFRSVYNRNNPVVLQTCIANEGISTWGRLFVIAEPISETVAQAN